jgi:hypothetical protein
MTTKEALEAEVRKLKETNSTLLTNLVEVTARVDALEFQVPRLQDSLTISHATAKGYRQCAMDLHKITAET